MRVASLFSGIGGIDLPIEQCGHEIVWANEKEKYACVTYSYNFSTVQLVKS